MAMVGIYEIIIRLSALAKLTSQFDSENEIFYFCI